ncbi:hypothetical protein LIER_38837 [Lithospermum erythrorhizon]|uniref:Uncharacterized protein n=1 Tax=Lithospermum erythrorhizon TaxID=34254 RepID=A0AAV3Q8M1_LITER
MHSLLYTNSVLPEYGSARTTSYKPLLVHQTNLPVDANAALLQDLLANQRNTFDEPSIRCQCSFILPSEFN